MKDRLKEFIAYKTGGKQTEFCELVGWKPPYLAKLLRGEDFGIKPIITLLSAFPEVDARWLLLGTGTMLTDAKFATVRREMFDNMTTLLDLERYMPVMTADELRSFEGFVTGGGKPDFSPSQLAEWEGKLTDREKNLEAKFAAANNNGKTACRQKKVK